MCAEVFRGEVLYYLKLFIGTSKKEMYTYTYKVDQIWQNVKGKWSFIVLFFQLFWILKKIKK